MGRKSDLLVRRRGERLVDEQVHSCIFVRCGHAYFVLDVLNHLREGVRCARRKLVCAQPQAGVRLEFRPRTRKKSNVTRPEWSSKWVRWPRFWQGWSLWRQLGEQGSALRSLQEDGCSLPQRRSARARSPSPEALFPAPRSYPPPFLLTPLSTTPPLLTSDALCPTLLSSVRACKVGAGSDFHFAAAGTRYSTCSRLSMNRWLEYSSKSNQSKAPKAIKSIRSVVPS